MSKFNNTDAGRTFIASGPSRETSPAIMEAIAFFARDTNEAERLWNGDGFGEICYPTDLWERVTRNGQRNPTEFVWGAAGALWWDDLKARCI